MSNKNYAIIMAGGVGSRFWPWSRTQKPKQFLDILNTGKTLIEQTFDRVCRICPPENILIVTNEQYRADTQKFLPQLPPQNILCEPARRNTAPCIAYGVFRILQSEPDANILIAPADHVILKEDTFVEVVNQGIAFASTHDALLTIGLKPHRPDTGYGYINVAGEQALLKNAVCELHPVKAFREKPDHQLAEEFVKDGNYYWNSGMFIWSLRSINKAFELLLPDVYALFAQNADKFGQPAENEAIQQIYNNCRSISIDYGIMEKAQNVYVLCTEIGWSDIGTWGALYEHTPKDEAQNASPNPKALFVDSQNCMVRSSSNKVLVVQGLDDYIIVDEDDALLICKKSDEQKIRGIVDSVSQQFGDQYI